MGDDANQDASAYVQYGCGLCAPPTWTNFDVSPTLRLQKVPVVGALARIGRTTFPRNARYGDVIQGLPVAAGSCKAVYCSHILEHLSLEDCRTAIKNSFSLLRPGGTFRFVLPDLEFHLRKYIESKSPRAAVEFMEQSWLGVVKRPRGVRHFVHQWLGNAGHLWMWDYN